MTFALQSGAQARIEEASLADPSAADMKAADMKMDESRARDRMVLSM